MTQRPTGAFESWAMIYRHFRRFPELRGFPQEKREHIWILFLAENRIHRWARPNPDLVYAFLIPGIILGVALGYWIGGDSGGGFGGAAMAGISLYVFGIVHSNMLRPALKDYLKMERFKEAWKNEGSEPSGVE